MERGDPVINSVSWDKSYFYKVFFLANMFIIWTLIQWTVSNLVEAVARVMNMYVALGACIVLIAIFTVLICSEYVCLILPLGVELILTVVLVEAAILVGAYIVCKLSFSFLCISVAVAYLSWLLFLVIGLYTAKMIDPYKLVRINFIWSLVMMFVLLTTLLATFFDESDTTLFIFMSICLVYTIGMLIFDGINIYYSSFLPAILQKYIRFGLGVYLKFVILCFLISFISVKTNNYYF